MTAKAAERITRDDGQAASPDDFIDEAVIGDAHIEMLSDRNAYLRLGAHTFQVFVEWPWLSGPRLRVRYFERELQSSAALEPSTPRPVGGE